MKCFVGVEVQRHLFVTSALFAVCINFTPSPPYHLYSLHRKLREVHSQCGPPEKYWDCTSNYENTRSFNIIYNSLFIIHPVMRRCINYVSGSFVKQTINYKLYCKLANLLGVNELRCYTLFTGICRNHVTSVTIIEGSKQHTTFPKLGPFPIADE